MIKISLRKKLFFFGCLIGSLLMASSVWILWDFPSIDSIPEATNTPSIRITDRHGKLLYEILEKDTGRHFALPIDSIPLDLQNATIATEDIHFYTNPGIDFQGILRAAWINLRGGETIAGGSTITQQIARTLLLNPQERSVKRKIREIILSWQISHHYSKNEILALYLNQIYYGGLAYGVEAASQTYFGKSVTDLDLAECAMLAGIPQAPAIYNPLINFEKAKERQLTVLSLMEKVGFITRDQFTLAANEPLVLTSTPYPIEAPHFVMMVKNRLDEILFSDSDTINLKLTGGLTVKTTLDLDWQHIAENAVSAQINKLKNSPDGLGHNVNSAALVSLNPSNGEILVLVGSPNYFDTDINGAINMAISPRQPGSALKPIVYAAALDPARSNPWTAGTMVLDVNTSFATHEQLAYNPSNYDGLEHGPVLIRQALASSLNIPAVITLDHIGLETLFNLANKLGIDTLTDPHESDLSIALGGGAVRLLDLTAAYASFANTGYRIYPQLIIDITDQNGNVIYTQSNPSVNRVIDERVAWLISDILSDNDARTLGFGKNSILQLGFPAAVKTGTTTNFHDNWTVGYTPDLVTGVWTGNTDYKPMRDVTGLTGAAPIWHYFMRSVLSSKYDRHFEQPAGLVQVEICSLSGLLPTPECPFQRYEWFINDTQPTTYDTIYKSVSVTDGSIVDTNITNLENHSQHIIVLDLPASARTWAASQGFSLYNDFFAASLISSTTNPEVSPIYISSPAPYSGFIISPNSPSNTQKINISVATNTPFTQVELWMDNNRLATFDHAPYEIWWVLTPGEHRLWATGITTDGQEIATETVSLSVQAPNP